MKALNIISENWEGVAAESNRWHSVLPIQLRLWKKQVQTLAEEKRDKIAQRVPNDAATI